ncbi:hypothetical protein K493DRAFT_339047 [Basidiobolus meristosporus CBS 931.73]|uniref:Uncharacterized protein n=1 Tax=Basidiobolus meristosporus CBS 931.73 TaxID=1314790 RepID=A0A1Y1Y1T2_9FUNG|nr:hypothetical protein K493DRAFT_339047 [Basidiobolus meristosporus CBS 931.73]|eukprot:ORX91963.1 hypothetical protein K493DRAFT_339047 [Basidiobolus meristosporus CBS 931.73]
MMVADLLDPDDRFDNQPPQPAIPILQTVWPFLFGGAIGSLSGFISALISYSHNAHCDEARSVLFHAYDPILGPIVLDSGGSEKPKLSGSWCNVGHTSLDVAGCFDQNSLAFTPVLEGVFRSTDELRFSYPGLTPGKQTAVAQLFEGFRLYLLSSRSLSLMFSIKNIIHSDTSAVPNHTAPKFPLDTDSISINHSPLDRATLLDRTLTAKYLGVLKTRLSFARYKVENEWEDKSFTEILRIRKRGSPSKAETNRPPREPLTTYLSPRTPVDFGRKRDFVEGPNSPRASPSVKTLGPGGFGGGQVVYGLPDSDPDPGCHPAKRHCRGLLTPLSDQPRPVRPKDTFAGHFPSDPNHLMGSTISGRMVPREVAFFQDSYKPVSFATSPSPSPSPWPIPQPIPNPIPGSHSFSPALDTAEIVACSPHSSAPGTPRLLPLEHSSIEQVSTGSKPRARDLGGQGVYAISIENDSCEFVSVNAYTATL